ncbi:MAG: glycoside hydrolase family 43 protein [Muribaculaceae bacterium]|nr:glycoside hydrolase family 43 protein [Muribaculaceae bacterium]
MPIVQTKYTADPAPIVRNDTIFLYTSHDEDNAEGFLMKNWLLYTSTDMKNWQDRGIVASLKDFAWYNGDNGAWAIQVVERNGKWYMYCPIHGHGIGVLVSDSPYGPFKDPIGQPLIWQKEHWEDIDPTVFIDDDGQAYLYWGNPHLYMVKLNEDMISYSGPIVRHPDIIDYQEGPWFYRRGDNYYLAFASTCCPEGIGYAMSKSPIGPWEYKGHIMDHTDRTRGNHPGIIDYKGKSYLFGQNSELLKLEQPEYLERRSVSVAEMHYNPDGSIQEVPYWFDNVVEQIEPFDPYREVEAETMSWGYGMRTTPRNQWAPDRWNQLVTAIDDGDYIRVSGVDFADGPKAFSVKAQCPLYGGVIEIRVDDVDGPQIGEVIISGTKNKIETFTVPTASVTGIHDLYLVFKGSKQQKNNLFNLDSWQFSK